MYTELNFKIAQILGYTVRTQEDEKGFRAVIVAPDDYDLWYTESSSDDWGRGKITNEKLIERAWRNLWDSDEQQYAEEGDWEYIPPSWDRDATEAARLLNLLPVEYEMSLKSNRQLVPGETQWYCSLTHIDVTKCVGSGMCYAPGIAICQAWLTAKAIEHAQTVVAQPPEEIDDQWKQRMINALDGLSDLLGKSD